MFKIPSDKNELERMNLFNIIQLSHHKSKFFNFLNSKPAAKIRVNELDMPFRVPISVILQDRFLFSLDILLICSF